MANFSYNAVNADGQSVNGTLAATSRSAALDALARQGLTPISVKEARSERPEPVKTSTQVRGRVSAEAAEGFIRELSNLLSGGVSLSKSLQILSREASNPAAKAQWTAIHDDVVGGATLADAMNRWRKTFSPVQVAMVRAGETGGFLSVVLDQIAEFRGRERDLKGKVKGAMIYPAVLACLSCVVVVVLLTFFIPRFSAIFKEFGGTLPALTRGIIAVSQGMGRYGLALLGVVVLAVVFVRRTLRSESGRRGFELLLLRTPGVGTVLARFALVRFCRMLGTLLGAGVSLVTALKVAREALGNQTLSDALNRSIEEVQKGSSMARSLSSCTELFPSSVIEVIAVAEESARLDKELLRLAATNEMELDRRLRILVTLAEPAMLMCMAAVVGVVVIGMLLPVFTLQDYIH